MATAKHTYTQQNGRTSSKLNLTTLKTSIPPPTHLSASDGASRRILFEKGSRKRIGNTNRTIFIHHGIPLVGNESYHIHPRRQCDLGLVWYGTAVVRCLRFALYFPALIIGPSCLTAAVSKPCYVEPFPRALNVYIVMFVCLFERRSQYCDNWAFYSCMFHSPRPLWPRRKIHKVYLYLVRFILAGTAVMWCFYNYDSLWHRSTFWSHLGYKWH